MLARLIFASRLFTRQVRSNGGVIVFKCTVYVAFKEKVFLTESYMALDDLEWHDIYGYGYFPVLFGHLWSFTFSVTDIHFHCM